MTPFVCTLWFLSGPSPKGPRIEEILDRPPGLNISFQPKGPFRTKSTTALNSVVVYYRRIFFTIAVANLLRIVEIYYS